MHTGIIDAAAAGPIASLSLDPHAAQPLHSPLSRCVFPPAAAVDMRSVAVALTRYMDRLLQQLPDSALCRAMLQVSYPTINTTPNPQPFCTINTTPNPQPFCTANTTTNP